MTTREIKKDVHWVGALDWNLRDFHGYSIYKGTTYNAYLSLDEKITLFDTVKSNFASDLLHNIHRLVEPEKIDYLVINHVEMDHSGALPQIIDRIKPEKIFCSPMGKKALIEHFHREDWPYEVVKTGDVINTGKKNITFIETRMLHWPDSMFSYIKEDRLLISSDAFGQHWATSERFDDEVNSGELITHAAKYYANILLLYSPLVQKLLAQVREMNLPIDMIAPDHGLIWRTSPATIINAYDSWSRQQTRPRAVIIYDTMWKSTAKMASAIADGLAQEDICVEIINTHSEHRSDIMARIFNARAILFGSPTLNNGILPKLADILTYMKGLKPRGRIGAAFGSYGWSGEAVGILNKYMEEMQFTIIDDGIKVKNVPTHDDLRRCVELGRKVALALKESPIA